LIKTEHSSVLNGNFFFFQNKTDWFLYASRMYIVMMTSVTVRWRFSHFVNLFI
jgi:hypothetical protein